MTKSLTKSISFKGSYKEQYDFLMSQDNPSRFVCELIKKHMEGEDDFESRVKDILMKYLGDQPQTVHQDTSVSVQDTSQPVDITQNNIDEIEDPW